MGADDPASVCRCRWLQDLRTGRMEIEMKYHIESETAHRIRVRLSSRKLTPEQAQILEYAFKGIAGVKKVTVYRATGGCALTFDCDRKEILRRLDSFRFENVEMLATKEAERISREEMRARKLGRS